MEILIGILCYGSFFAGVVIKALLEEANHERRRRFGRAMWAAERRNLRAFEAKCDRDRGDRLRRLKRTDWLAALRRRPARNDLFTFVIRQKVPDDWRQKNDP